MGGSGGELVNLPSAKTFFSAAMLLCDEDDICTIVFHSVIFNSVINSKDSQKHFVYKASSTHLLHR